MLGLDYETFLEFSPNLIFKMLIMYLRKENPDIIEDEIEGEGFPVELKKINKTRSKDVRYYKKYHSCI